MFEYIHHPEHECLRFNTFQDADPDGGDVLERSAKSVEAPTAYDCRLELLSGTADVRITYFMGGREIGAHVGVGYADRPMVLIANMQMTARAVVEEAWMEISTLQVLRWGA